MTTIMLANTPRQVRRGLSKTKRDALDAELKKLVGNTVPVTATPLSEGAKRYRLQIDDMTVGYEIDLKHDLVLVKAIMLDGDPPADEMAIVEAMRLLMADQNAQR